MNRLFYNGVHLIFPDNQIGGRAVRPQILENHFDILFNLKKFCGKPAMIRPLPGLKDEIHGRNRCLDLMDPHGVIVLHLRPFLLFLLKQPFSLLIRGDEKLPVQKLRLVRGSGDPVFQASIRSKSRHFLQ